MLREQNKNRWFKSPYQHLYLEPLESSNAQFMGVLGPAARIHVELYVESSARLYCTMIRRTLVGLSARHRRVSCCKSQLNIRDSSNLPSAVSPISAAYNDRTKVWLDTAILLQCLSFLHMIVRNESTELTCFLAASAPPYSTTFDASHVDLITFIGSQPI